MLLAATSLTPTKGRLMLALDYALGFLVAVIPAIVGLIIVALRGQGRAKGLGMIAFGVSAAIGLVTQTINLLIPRIIRSLGAAYSSFSTVWSIVLLMVYCLEMVLFALAIIASRQPAAPRQPEPGQPPMSG